jgi:hypothetical protein
MGMCLGQVFLKTPYVTGHILDHQFLTRAGLQCSRGNQQSIDLKHLMKFVVLRQILPGPEHLIQAVMERVVLWKSAL